MSARLLEYTIDDASIDLADFGLADTRAALRTMQSLMTGGAAVHCAPCRA
jgi:hypothetical protein